jgi:hypothetical protein
LYLVSVAHHLTPRCFIDQPRTVAITPGKAAISGLPFDRIRGICQRSTMAGLRAIYEAKPASPFKFIYMSGSGAERDQTKKPPVYTEYLKMRVSLYRGFSVCLSVLCLMSL